MLSVTAGSPSITSPVPSASNGYTTTLTQAFAQWAKRPADQRFTSLESLHTAVEHHRATAKTARGLALRDLSIDPVRSARAEQPVLVGKTGTEAQFSHFAFGQFCRRIGAPADYLRSLPAPLVAENMNYGLQHADGAGDPDLALLFQQNGSLTVRAATTTKYTRIWNVDITRRLLRLVQQSPEWQPAPAAFDGSRGLYASDEDMFAFLVDNERRIFEKDQHGGLGRGFFVWNSEVGKSSFGVMTFFYEYVCGNHRVWGASGVSELRIRHIGNADDRAFGQLTVELRKYATASLRDDEARIERARAYSLGSTKDEVLDKVFGLRSVAVPRKTLELAYAKAVEHADWYGSPRTVWGFAGGMTEVARDLPNADARVQLDRAAGKVMEMAF